MDGRVQLDESCVYLAFNKPLGVVTSMNDEPAGSTSATTSPTARNGSSMGRPRSPTPSGPFCSPTMVNSLYRLQHPRYGVPARPTSPRFPGRCPVTRASALRQGIELRTAWWPLDSFKVVDQPRQGPGQCSRGRMSTLSGDVAEVAPGAPRPHAGRPIRLRHQPAAGEPRRRRALAADLYDDPAATSSAPASR